MKKKAFIKRPPQSGDVSLQITSMADIFMILLVFLLKNFASGVSNTAPSQGAKLPLAHAKQTVRDTLKLEIVSSSILVDQKPIVRLKNFDFAENALQEGLSDPLYKILFSERKKIPVPNMESNLLVMADERTPYTTIKVVIASAAKAGFVDLQLVVVQPD
jgi:biopolymer transport protein ExbD